MRSAIRSIIRPIITIGDPGIGDSARPGGLTPSGGTPMAPFPSLRRSHGDSSRLTVKNPASAEIQRRIESVQIWRQHSAPICASDHRWGTATVLYLMVRGRPVPVSGPVSPAGGQRRRCSLGLRLHRRQLTWVSRHRAGSARRWVLPSPMPTGPLFPLHQDAGRPTRHFTHGRKTAAKPSGQGQTASLTLWHRLIVDHCP